MRRLVDYGRRCVMTVLVCAMLPATVLAEPIGRGLLMSSKRVTSDSWGRHSYLETHTYDLHGNRLTSVTEFDAYDDGEVDSISSVTNTYDSRGRVLTTRHEWGMTTYTYDAHGRVIEELIQSDTDGDGVFDVANSGITTYDSSGNIVKVAFVSTNWDGSRTRWIVTTTFGPNRIELFRVDDVDWDDDGVFDERGETVSTYDARGNRLTSDFVYDNFLYDDWDYVSNTTMTYDQQGNLLSTTLFQDYAPGLPDYGQTEFATYDIRGRRITMTIRFDYGGDGVLEYQYAETVTYDEAGNQLTWMAEADSGADGIDTIYRSAWTYDPAGRVTNESGEVDGANNEWDSRSFVTREYDATGNLTRQIEESYDHLSVLQSRTVMTNTY